MAFSTSIEVPDNAVIPPVYPALLSAVEFAAGTDGAYSADDSRVQTLLDGATAAVRRYCRWHVAPVVDETMVLDYDGGDVIVLPTLRLVSVSSLEIDGETVTDFDVSHNGEIHLLRRYLPRMGGIKVVMRHGFDAAAVADIKQAIQQVVGNAIASPLGATREQVGQVSIQWSTTAPGVSGGISLLERDYAILDQYRLPGGA